MRIPLLRGVIERRVLVNYRVAPDALARLLPAPFRPQVVRGRGLAGICLIRLGGVRPRLVPRALGITSENAAHRVAVEWDEDGRTRTGVYVARRDTASTLNALAGGRLFPGVHHRASITSVEDARTVAVQVRSDDGVVRVDLEGTVARGLPDGSIFGSLDEASAFFEKDALGLSPAREAGAFDAMELRTLSWRVDALDVTRLASSTFDDPAHFPRGTVELDHALLMRGVAHEWRGRETLRTDPRGVLQCETRFQARTALRR